MRKFFLILLVFLILGATKIEARLLPRFRKAAAGSTPVNSGLIVSVRLRPDREALELSFGNLNKVKNVVYTLSYNANGIDQGVNGMLSAVDGNGNSRELLFGTCSSGVCTYHQNITGMKLEIVTELPSGKKTLRRYLIRV